MYAPASVLQIIDEKSLIKKYQTEIRRLKEELEQLKMGIITGMPSKDTGEDNIILWKQKVLCCFFTVYPCFWHYAGHINSFFWGGDLLYILFD